ncbi:MAG TPA: phosphodiester glycosidase family protein [Armatimonadota bacterium]|jgi:exopolysaccharide biosynthesis protein
MKRLPIFLVICLLFTSLVLQASADNRIAYEKRFIRGVAVNIITANLNDSGVQVSPAVARRGIGFREGFGSMLSRLKPAAAITGTYACTRSFIPVGHIVIDGKRINSGEVGTIVAFRIDKKVEFIPLKESSRINWSYCPYAISTGPRLVTYGVAGVYPRNEGFRDPALYRKARRSALGVTKANKLLLVTVGKPVYLRKLAAIMRDLGAYHAVNLDGGSSTALNFKGRSICHPSRPMTNLLVVYESPIQFQNMKGKLAPTLIRMGSIK